MSKTKLINVRGLKEIDDPFYRYKMEPINIINQRNTDSITNIGTIAKSLNRSPDMIVDYMKKRLSIAMKYDKKTFTIEVKSITIERAQIAIYEFIEKYVLCQKCRNPETELSENQKSFVCKACSHKSVIN